MSARLIVYAVRSGINFLRYSAGILHADICALPSDGIKPTALLSFCDMPARRWNRTSDRASAAVVEVSRLGLGGGTSFCCMRCVGLMISGLAPMTLRTKKNTGLIKAIGISTHHIDACADVADIPSCDVVFPYQQSA